MTFVLGLFHEAPAAFKSVVLATREDPAPDVAIHEYPVHAIPFNLEYKASWVLPRPCFHSLDPETVVVYAI